MTLREKVARLMARQYWLGRGQEITDEMEDGFWMASLKDANAILALLSTADSEQQVREAFEAGYDSGHNDTVESRYISPSLAAEDYMAALSLPADSLARYEPTYVKNEVGSTGSDKIGGTP